MNANRWTVLGFALGVLGLVSGFLACAWLLGGEEPARVPRYDQTTAMARPGEEASPRPETTSPGGSAQPVLPSGSPPGPGDVSPGPGAPEPGGSALPVVTPGAGEGSATKAPAATTDPDRATSTLAPTAEHPASPAVHAGRSPGAKRVAQAPPGPEPPLHAPGTGETPEHPTPTPEAKPDDEKKPAAKGTKGKGSKAGKAGPTTTPRKGGDEDASAPPILRDHARNLDKWKPGIARYCKRHYGDEAWKLEPTCIVLHYTAGSTFPSNLVTSSSFDREPPGLASHYVVDGTKIWEILPPTVRSRAAYGINHRAVNIEMVATSAGDLARRPETLKSCVSLVRYLMERFDIPKSKVYSHTDVSHMDPKRVPEVKDLVDSSPYGKPDPGEQNMRSIKARL